MKNDLVDWLLKNYGQEIMRPGLHRMKHALSLLENFPNPKIITIAGTNGKGETALRLSELLLHKSYCTWTSPHILRLSERFRSEEGEIEDVVLERIIGQCHKLKETHKLELSFYEFLFFVFCKWVHEKKPEFLILEVGLGGRLDAVNIFDADIVLIPSISRDHQEILGKRYDQILGEKLGVLRKKSLLMHFLDSVYLQERAQITANSVGAEVRNLNLEVSIPPYDFPLRNKTLAHAAFSFFFPMEKGDFGTSSLEHRGEVISGPSEWLLFGSHNVDGVRKLILFLHSGTYTFSGPPFDKVILTFSKRDLADTRVMMRMFKAAGLGKVIVTSFDHPKAESAQKLEVMAYEEGLDFVQDIEKEFTAKSSRERILVTGSYYFIGYAKSLICKF